MNSCISKIIIAAVGVSVTSAVWGRPLSCVDVSFGESDKMINWVLPALVHMSDSEIVETLRSCELRHGGSRSRHYLLVEREEDLGPKGTRFDARSGGRSNSQHSWIWSGGRIVEGLGLGKRFSIREVVSGKRPREIYSVGTSIYWFILPTGKCWLSASYPWRESKAPALRRPRFYFMCDTREGAADILEVRRAILKWYPAGVGEVVFQDGRGFGDIPYISDFAPFLLAPSRDAVRDGPATLRTSCELDRFAIDCKILP